jgi:hypothetical protein
MCSSWKRIDVLTRSREYVLEYFAWHKQERLTINESNWKDHRFLVMQCLGFMDTQCGGTADRLKPFLMLLREAHKSKRLLFIHWNRPARLEEFLVPPRGGMDWRAPPFLETLVSTRSALFAGRYELYSSLTSFRIRSSSIILLRCSFMIRIMVHDHSLLKRLRNWFPKRHRFSEVDSNP